MHAVEIFIYLTFPFFVFMVFMFENDAHKFTCLYGVSRSSISQVKAKVEAPKRNLLSFISTLWENVMKSNIRYAIKIYSMIDLKFIKIPTLNSFFT